MRQNHQNQYMLELIKNIQAIHTRIVFESESKTTSMTVFETDYLEEGKSSSGSEVIIHLHIDDITTMYPLLECVVSASVSKVCSLIQERYNSKVYSTGSRLYLSGITKKLINERSTYVGYITMRAQDKGVQTAKNHRLYVVLTYPTNEVEEELDDGDEITT